MNAPEAVGTALSAVKSTHRASAAPRVIRPSVRPGMTRSDIPTGYRPATRQRVPSASVSRAAARNSIFLSIWFVSTSHARSLTTRTSRTGQVTLAHQRSPSPDELSNRVTGVTKDSFVWIRGAGGHWPGGAQDLREYAMADYRRLENELPSHPPPDRLADLGRHTSAGHTAGPKPIPHRTK